MPAARATNGHTPDAPGPPASTALAVSSFSDTTPVVIDAADAPLSLTVDDVLNYIAPGAPRPDALLFLMTCKQLRLNPLAREAYLLSLSGGKWSTVVSKQGYIRAAQRHESYDGHDAGIIAQPFDPKTKERGAVREFPGTFLPPGHIVLGGWAKVFRKGVSRPIESRVSMTEYGKDQPGPWRSLTCTMIRKVALVHAIREAFALGGYDEAEMPAMAPAGGQEWTPEPRAVQVVAHEAPWTPIVDADDRVPAKPARAPKAPRPEAPPRLPADKAKQLHDLMVRAEMDEYEINAALLKRGVDRIVDLTVEQATVMINKLEGMLSVADWNPLDKDEVQIQEALDRARDKPAEVAQGWPGEDPADIAEAARRAGEDPTAIRHCSDCKKRQHYTIGGWCCPNGHGGAPSLEELATGEPGDDDEPIGGAAHEQREIDAEFDRPIEVNGETAAAR